jgi:hypothetical protein
MTVAIVIVCNVIIGIASIFLFFGAKGVPKFCVPWLICEFIEVLLGYLVLSNCFNLQV